MFRRLCSIFVLFLVAMVLPAQEKNFESQVLTEIPAPARLIIHRNDFWGLGQYKFSDGTNLSFRELNRVLKQEADAMYVKRTNVFQTLACAFLAGTFVSGIASIYADEANQTTLAKSSLLISIACICFGEISGVLSQSYREIAVDTYNLKMLGLTEN